MADAYGAEVIRDCSEQRLAPASRKALTLRFARLAAMRIERINHYAQSTNMELPKDYPDD